MMNFSTKIVLLSAGLSLFLSIYLFFFMQSEDAKLYGIFVGLWVPSILSAYRVIESSVSASEIDQEAEHVQITHPNSYLELILQKEFQHPPVQPFHIICDGVHVY